MTHKLLAAVLIALSLATAATAREPLVKSYSAVVVQPLPAATKLMTPAEFYHWAVETNAQAENIAFARNEAAKHGKPSPRERHALVSESSGTIKRRFGGGVGYGGYGGNGGYAGYGQNNSGSSGMYSNINGAGGGNYVYNYGYGFGNPGNASQEANDQSSLSYEMIYRDPDVWDGGAVTIINPFVKPK